MCNILFGRTDSIRSERRGYATFAYGLLIIYMTLTINDTIRQLAEQYLPMAIEIRRHLHRNPELSFHEVETGKYIAARLRGWGIPHQHGVAENGVVALIEGIYPDRHVTALRADFDALPITEANDVPYRSQHPGVMHACGHDVHTAALLGVARILWEIREQLTGTVKLIFQPAEEKAPGGASIMIKEGVLRDPAPASIFGQHVHPPLAVGKVGMRAGKYMASTDELTLTIYGKGGHGALPHTTVDPVVIAAHFIVAAQQIASRKADPTKPTVITFGQIETAGGAHNVIPESVRLLGTLRCMDEEWRAEAKQQLRQLATGIAESMGGRADLEILNGYPYLVNDPLLTERTRRYAEEYLGTENVVDLPIRMTGEDFAYYSHEIPGCFYRLGIRNDDLRIGANGLHTPTFDVDEQCLKTGMGLMAYLAWRELSQANR